ncbi:hypothetical protein PHYSODRAFT_375945, partial [Phytophthora sojae]
MNERRMRCGSKKCKLYGKCKFVMKIWLFAHARDIQQECEGPHKAVITVQMKKIILQQDECAVPPQLIWSSMHRSSDILEPNRGYPTLSQVTNCAKYLRCLQGTKNSIQVVRKLVR